MTDLQEVLVQVGFQDQMEALENQVHLDHVEDLGQEVLVEDLVLVDLQDQLASQAYQDQPENLVPVVLWDLQEELDSQAHLEDQVRLDQEVWLVDLESEGL